MLDGRFHRCLVRHRSWHVPTLGRFGRPISWFPTSAVVEAFATGWRDVFRRNRRGGGGKFHLCDAAHPYTNLLGKTPRRGMLYCRIRWRTSSITAGRCAFRARCSGPGEICKILILHFTKQRPESTSPATLQGIGKRRPRASKPLRGGRIKHWVVAEGTALAASSAEPELWSFEGTIREREDSRPRVW